MSDLEKIEREAVNRYLNGSVFPIAERDSRKIGSGFFFQRGQHHYVMSAAHILDDLVTKGTCTYVMPASPPSHERVAMVPLGSSHFMRIQGEPQPVGEDDYLEDVAVHRIAQSAAERFKANGWIFANEDSFFDGACDECIIFGWPTSLMTLEPGGNARNLAGEPIILRMNVISKPSGSGPKLPGEFFLDCPSGVPVLNGISGSPVWTSISQSRGVWEPSKLLKVVGIQHAVGKDDTYVRATDWRIVSRLVDALEERFGS